ncbi:MULTISPECIES: PTS sugar transporter subunit IIA [Devosia]|uniref:PTS sugar transporter subunit IIA n=1 Tax=Devosia TaxID=46913 RepID=UPI000CE9A04F|nr:MULTISPECIES: PTS sugar transporter subunit IIA [Devosia]AVF02311.1 transcriptional regulator [Devosia sp. I507]
MKLTELFSTDHVFLKVPVTSREQLFAFLSERAGKLGLVNSQLCTKALHVREELGSTGLGNGIAIPHARVEGLEKVVGLIATLERPINFEAVDGEPVDLVMMLLLPEHSGGDQIKALSRIARVARNEAAVNALRRAQSVDEVTEIIEGVDEGL